MQFNRCPLIHHDRGVVVGNEPWKQKKRIPDGSAPSTYLCRFQRTSCISTVAVWSVAVWTFSGQLSIKSPAKKVCGGLTKREDDLDKERNRRGYTVTLHYRYLLKVSRKIFVVSPCARVE